MSVFERDFFCPSPRCDRSAGSAGLTPLTRLSYTIRGAINEPMSFGNSRTKLTFHLPVRLKHKVRTKPGGSGCWQSHSQVTKPRYEQTLSMTIEKRPHLAFGPTCQVPHPTLPWGPRSPPCPAIAIAPHRPQPSVAAAPGRHVVDVDVWCPPHTCVPLSHATLAKSQFHSVRNTGSITIDSRPSNSCIWITYRPSTRRAICNVKRQDLGLLPRR